MQADFAIIGGGIIGLLLAAKLAEQGAQVAILDKNAHAGQEASWAGGGIISPLYPWRYADPVTALASKAQSIYPQLTQRLYQSTGIDPEYKKDGLIMMAVGDEALALQWASQHQKSMQACAVSDCQQWLPKVALPDSTIIHMPEVAQVRNPRLLKSLIAYVQQFKNVSWHLGQQVVSFKRAAHRVESLETDTQQTIQADQFIINAGAWSSALVPDSNIEVTPVRGQMLIFAPSDIRLNKIVLCNGKYLIPRQDGRIIVGSTLEYVGFDKQTTSEALTELQHAAYQMLPALKHVAIEKHWAGLRPGASHGIPYIGRVTDYDNLYINAGHFRNGLVLAPAAVELMFSLLTGAECDLDPTPYAPDTRLA